MSDLSYAYAVARIRVLEKNLLSGTDIEQMTAAPDEERVLAFLRDRGWGVPGEETDAETLLIAESAKPWALMRELKIDPSILEVFSYRELYHNLKAAVREVCSQETHPGIFFSREDLGGEEMLRIVREKDWNALPVHMRNAGQEAYETLLQTRDGQLCDIIIDRAALEAILEAGRTSKEQIIRDYASRYVDVADIRIAARCAATGKTRDFIERAMAPSNVLDRQRLVAASSAGREAVMEYLAGTAYAPAAEALAESPSAFERWCDNAVMESIRPQKTNPFSSGPVIAYLIARENEIKMARIILTAKANGLPEEAIRERAREMYV